MLWKPWSDDAAAAAPLLFAINHGSLVDLSQITTVDSFEFMKKKCIKVGDCVLFGTLVNSAWKVRSDIFFYIWY